MKRGRPAIAKPEIVMAAKLTLISHKLCPYVQRAVIALNEKGVPFERVDIDLADKPDWFLKLSPLGKVPVLVVRSDEGEVALFESNVICEYIEDTQGGAKLHPQDPLRIPVKATMLSGAWRPRDPVDDDQGGARAW
jgi:glutathione S-transferase